MSDPAQSPRASRDHFPLVAIAGIVLLGYVTAAVIRAADRGNFADALSTYRSDARGARGLYLLAEESGLPVRRLQHDLELLEPGSQLVLLAVDGAPDIQEMLELPFQGLDGGTDGGFEGGLDGGAKNTLQAWLVQGILGPPDAGAGARPEREGLNSLFVVSMTEDERKSLLAHVEKGATLLYAPSKVEGDPLVDELYITLRAASSAEPVELRPAVPSPFTAGVSAALAPVRAYLGLPPDAVPLLEDEEGQVVMATLPRGLGQVVVLTAPDLAANQWLAREGNAQLWLSTLGAMAEGGPVLFDEFHHGFTSERSVAELASRYGLHFAIGQLLLGLCLWAAALKRFVRPRTPAEEERQAAADALSAISRIYREGHHGTHAAQQILRGLLQDLAPLAGRRPQDGAQALAAALESRGRRDLAAALTEVAGLASFATSERDVERTARAAALARRRLQGAQGNP